jgi:hypothetical protein
VIQPRYNLPVSVKQPKVKAHSILVSVKS